MENHSRLRISNIGINEYVLHKELVDKLPDKSKKKEQIEKFRLDTEKSLRIRENVPDVSDEKVRQFYDMLSDSVFSAAEEFKIPLPEVRLKVSWLIHRYDEKKNAYSEGYAGASANPTDVWMIKIHPKAISKVLHETNSDMAKLDIDELIYHESKHLQSYIYDRSGYVQSREKLETIKHKISKEDFFEVKEFLTSREIDGLKAQIKAIEKFSPKDVVFSLYRNLILILRKQELKSRMKRRKELNVDF